MHALIAFAMQDRAKAVLATTLFALLAILLPLLAIPSAALVGLVTLRLGLQRGFEVVALSGLVVLAVGATLGSLGLPLAFLLIWLPAWLLAGLWRLSGSLSLTLEVGLLVAVVPLSLEALFFSTQSGGWIELLKPVLDSLIQEKVLDPEQRAELANLLSLWMTASIAGFFYVQTCLGLFLARAWQARLYNPKGFGREFRQWGVSQPLLYLATLLFLAVLLLGATQWWAVRILTVLLIVLFLFQGLAVVHAFLANSAMGRPWLIGVYLLLLFAPPYMQMALAATGFADAWVDLRRDRTANGNDDPPDKDDIGD